MQPDYAVPVAPGLMSVNQLWVADAGRSLRAGTRSGLIHLNAPTLLMPIVL